MMICVTKEQDIQDKIMDYIKSIGGLPVKFNNIGIYAKAGVSDILACIRGRFVAIEVKKPGNKPSALQDNFINAINSKFKKNYEPKHDGNPIYDWGYVSGTRRVVLENFEGGYYGSNAFRKAHSKFFEGKLWKGETVYYEVVGFTHTGTPIMATADNKKLNDKEFIKQYGKTTTFSYGCEPDKFKLAPLHVKDGAVFISVDWIDAESTVYQVVPQSDIYVYRMTMTNEDGDVVEYTPEFMRYRCEQIGVKTVPVFWHGFLQEMNDGETAGEYAKRLAEQYYDGPDPIGKTHVREGVVVRIVNRPKFTAFKHKNWSFKALEGIVKVEATAPDMEEEQEVTIE